MTRNEKKKMLTELFQQKWWLGEFRDHFTEDLTYEAPMAPPGMLQSLNEGMTAIHMMWLSATVKTWEAEILKSYGPKEENGDTFFIIYNVKADVKWGGTENTYSNKRGVLRIRMNGDKICSIKEWFNPLNWIKAAGRDVPVFGMSIPMCNELSRAIHKEKPARPEYDMSPEACENRRKSNIECFGSLEKGYACSPIPVEKGFDRLVLNVPANMKEDVTPEEREYFDLWLAVGETKPWTWMPGAVVYETDDPYASFSEPCGYGGYNWPGNEEFGMFYANKYICYIELDDKGFCKRYWEFLNPIAKMNSVNKSLPSFPWLF